jgi:predicted DNA-binding transcriptional regulator AlpA
VQVSSAHATTSSRREFIRERQLREELGVSKAWIFARLREGTLRARKLGGVLLIERESVDELLATAEPWVPKPRKAAR